MIKRDPSTIVRNKSPGKTVSIRKDYRGILIEKSKKTHKISFVDQISKVKLKEEIQIESFKEFNSEMSYGNETTTCKCIII